MQGQAVVLHQQRLGLVQQPALLRLALHQPQVQVDPQRPAESLKAELAFQRQLALDVAFEARRAGTVAAGRQADPQLARLILEAGRQPRQPCDRDGALPDAAARNGSGCLDPLGDALCQNPGMLVTVSGPVKTRP